MLGDDNILPSYFLFCCGMCDEENSFLSRRQPNWTSNIILPASCIHIPGLEKLPMPYTFWSLPADPRHHDPEDIDGPQCLDLLTELYVGELILVFFKNNNKTPNKIDRNVRFTAPNKPLWEMLTQERPNLIPSERVRGQKWEPTHAESWDLATNARKGF